MVVGVISFGMATAWRGTAIFEWEPFRIQFAENGEFLFYCQAVLVPSSMNSRLIIVKT